MSRTTSSIEIPQHVEENLRWYCTREYEGMMGRKSVQGGIQDTLERGALCDMGGKDGDISETARRAARRLAEIEWSFRRLSLGHQAVLNRTFGDGRTEGLSAYGAHYCRAVLALPMAETMRRVSRSPRGLGAWLLQEAKNAAKQDRDGAKARIVVAKLRAGAIDLLAEAVERFIQLDETRKTGESLERNEKRDRSREASVRRTALPARVSVRRLADALGWHHDTAAAELERRQVPITQPARRGMASVIQTVELQTLWPEAATALGQAQARIVA